jgi:curved DNA-binding protein CbpA
MNTGDDPYDVLSVSKEATTAEIRTAYRKLATRHHPDKFQDPADKERNSTIFARIAGAYELLSDERQRAEYDRQQEEETDANGKPPGFDGNAVYDVPPPARREPRKPSSGKKVKKKHPMHFHDPYEVFKAAFEKEFGFPYPGSEYDNIPDAELKKQLKLKDAKDRERKLLTNGDVGDKQRGKSIENGSNPAGGSNSRKNTGIASGEPRDTKKKGLLTMFGHRDKNPSDETALVVHSRNQNKKNSRAIVKKGSSDMVVREDDESVEYGPPPGGNNRPVSMETKEIKIQHPDGTVETIEETTITRPDGSTETMRRTDKPDSNSGNWTKPKKAGDLGNGKKPLALTNGSEKKLLTNGDKKKMLAIEDDKSKKKASKSSSSKTPVKAIESKKEVLAIENGKASAPQTVNGRRLLGWGGGK